MSHLLTVGCVVASYSSPWTLQSISSSSFFVLWTVAGMNVRYLSHAFVNFEIAALIVTNAVIEVVQVTSDAA